MRELAIIEVPAIIGLRRQGGGEGMTETVGEKIKQMREQQNLSVSTLANLTRVPATTIRDIEAGRATSPRLSTLMPIARVLGLTLGELDVANAEVLSVLDPTQVSALLAEWALLSDAGRTFALNFLRLLRQDGMYHNQSED
jgi:transcriptional regulator with XRE-family HTH domain